MPRRDDIVDAHRYDYFVCPNCGNEVKVGSRACPHCGSDDDTGWAEDAGYYEDYGPGYGGEDDFDYRDYVRREFGFSVVESSPRRGPIIRRTLFVVGVSLITIALLWMFFTV